MDEKKFRYADIFQELLKINSYDKISVNAICEKCGTFPSNFYYHFRSKDDLAEWIFDNDCCLMRKSTDNALSIQTDLLYNMQERRIFYLRSLDKNASCSLNMHMKKSIIDYICRVKHLDQNNIDEITRVKLDFMAFGWIMTIHAWLEGTIEMSTESFSARLYERMTSIDLNGK